MAETSPKADTSWRMCAHLRNGMLVDIGSRSYVVLQRLPHPIVEVEVAIVPDEDRAATHWGWIQSGANTPSTIWPTRALYRVCFHDSPEAQEKAGHGRTVRLAVRPIGRLATL